MGIGESDTPATTAGATLDDRAASHPRLLVSVRNVDEARAAVRGGADVVDVKEPARGALGRADPATIADIVRTCRAAEGGATWTSAAHGELGAWLPGGPTAADTAPPTPPVTPDFVKIGLAGLVRATNWRTRLRRWSRDVARRIDESTRTRPAWVGVAYADAAAAAAPPADDVIAVTIDEGGTGVLFDTFDKQGGSLLECVTPDQLHRWQQRIREAGLFTAFAGRLRLEDLATFASSPPDFVAVRSAACVSGDRGLAIDEGAVRRLRDAVTRLGPVKAGALPPSPRSVDH